MGVFQKLLYYGCYLSPNTRFAFALRPQLRRVEIITLLHARHDYPRQQDGELCSFTRSLAPSPTHIHPGRWCWAASISTSRPTPHFFPSIPGPWRLIWRVNINSLLAPRLLFWVWPVNSTIRRVRRWQEREAGVSAPFNYQGVRSSGGSRRWPHPTASAGCSSPGSSLSSLGPSSLGRSEVPGLFIAPGHFTIEDCFS